MYAALNTQETSIEHRAIGLLQKSWLTLYLAAFAIAASLLPGCAEILEFNREAVVNGQFWRVATGNFVHWNADHLMWDALMFMMLGVGVERRNRATFAAVTGLSAIAVSATVWLATSLPTYRGLSGIDSALFVMLAVWYLTDSLKSRSRLPAFIPAILLLGFVGKICYEIVTGHTYFVDSSAAAFIPLPEVHLAGAIIGLAVLGGILRLKPFQHDTKD